MTATPPSRRFMALAGGIAGGAASAALLAVAFMHPQTMLIFLAYLAAIPLLMAGLGTGLLGALMAGGAGIGGLTIIEPASFPLVYAAMYAIPAVMLTMIALRPAPALNGIAAPMPVESSLLTALTVYPCLLFLTAFAAMHFQGKDMLALTGDLLHTAMEPIKTEVDAATLKQFSAVLDQLAKVLPALIGCSWMLVMMLSLIVAQSALKQQGWNLRANFRLQNIGIPTWLIFAAAITGVMALTAPAPYNYLGANLCFVMCVPFFFIGLAVVHAWAATTKAPTLVLISFYLVLTVLVWTALLVAVLGVVDQWLNFRRRFAGMKQGGK